VSIITDYYRPILIQISKRGLGGKRYRLKAKMRMLFTSALVIAIFFGLSGCHASPLSYPYFWDYTKAKPSDADLVGTYEVLKTRLPGDLAKTVREADAVVVLKADHTAVLTNVPEFDAFGERVACQLAGTAEWALDDKMNSGWGWSIAFQSYHPSTKPSARECNLGSSIWGGFLVLSRHAPYRLYSIVGDPDSDTGVEFGRTNR
jgi:hypothetical protein